MQGLIAFMYSSSMTQPHNEVTHLSHDFYRRGVIVNYERTRVTMADHAGEIKYLQFTGKAGQSFVSGIVEGRAFNACQLQTSAEDRAADV